VIEKKESKESTGLKRRIAIVLDAFLSLYGKMKCRLQKENEKKENKSDASKGCEVSIRYGRRIGTEYSAPTTCKRKQCPLPITHPVCLSLSVNDTPSSQKATATDAHLAHKVPTPRRLRQERRQSVPMAATRVPILAAPDEEIRALGPLEWSVETVRLSCASLVSTHILTRVVPSWEKGVRAVVLTAAAAIQGLRG
jgi:hypothetical protein